MSTRVAALVSILSALSGVGGCTAVGDADAAMEVDSSTPRGVGGMNGQPSG